MIKHGHKNLTSGPVPRHLVNLTLPLMVGVLGMLAFNLIDTYFIGRLGYEALAAISFTFPVIMLVSSLVAGISVGATALISRSIGADNEERAARETTDSLFLALMISFFLVIVGLNTVNPLFRVMGAGEEILSLIKDYMVIWYITILVLIVPFIGNSALTASGDTRTPALIMLLAIGLNALLDPILIFGWGPVPGLGIKGAALATALSRSVTLVLSIYILRYRGLITFKVPALSVVWGCWKEILSIGIPNGLSRMMTPLAAGMITALLASYGKEAVAAYGVSTRIEAFGTSVLVALSTALAPFVGQNIAKNYWQRINSALRYSIYFSLVWGGIIALILLLIDRWIANWFTDDKAVVDTVALYLSLVPLSLGFRGVYTLINSVLNTLKRPIPAFVISLLYTFVFLVPLAWLGGSLYDIKGIFGGIALSHILAAVLAYLFFNRFSKKLSKTQYEYVKTTMPTSTIH